MQVALSDLPAGLFNMMLEFWINIKSSYIAVVGWFTEAVIDIPGVPSLMSLFFGSAATVFLGFCLFRWVKKTFF